MNILTVLFLFIFVFFSSVVSAEEYSSTMSQYFNDIMFNDNTGSVQLRFKVSGPKYNYIHHKLSEKDYGSIEYGDLLTLKENESIRLATRGSSLWISNFKNIDENKKIAFPEATVVKGWYIENQIDLRSFGKGLRIIGFYIIAKPSLDLKINLKSKYEGKEGYIVIEEGELLIIEKGS